MNMTAKNKFKYSVDDFGTEVNVGDIIVYASQGSLYIGQVLGFTELAIYVSEYKKSNSMWSYRNTNISEHIITFLCDIYSNILSGDINPLVSPVFPATDTFFA